MKKVKLTNGGHTLVNNEDYKLISRYRWLASESQKGRFYVKRTTRPQIYLHRFLLSPPREKFTDHINGNTLDNRRSNLRVVSKYQNTLNKKIHKNNKSGYKGVVRINYTKRVKEWVARITVKGKQIYLGYYRTPEEAALAYDDGAKKYFGKFARMNFKGGDFNDSCN